MTGAAAPRAERPAADGGWRTLATVGVGYLLVSWGMTPVGAILPTISADLRVDVTAAGWILNAYFLLLVGAILIAGRVGDEYGHRRVFAAGILIFGLAAVGAGLAGRLEPLLVARGIQGLGAAMVFATSLALVAEVVPSARRGLAIGILTTTSSLASILGVAFSNYAVQSLSWHWAFFVMAPLAGVAFLLALRLPKGASAPAGGRASIDWPGGLLLFAALTALLLSLAHLHEGEESFAEGAHYHLPMHALALGLLALFAWVETRVRRPLLQLGMLRDGRFAGEILANGLVHMSMLALGFLLPFLLERGRGLGPSDTAQLMYAFQGFTLLGSLGAGWLYDRARTPRLGRATLGVVAGGLLLLGLGGGSLGFTAVVVVAALLGVGQGGFTTVNNTAIMGGAAPDQRGFASGMIETTRQLGHSIGVSFSSSVVAGALAGVAAADRPRAYVDGAERALLGMGALVALGLLAIIVPRAGRRAPESRPPADPPLPTSLRQVSRAP